MATASAAGAAPNPHPGTPVRQDWLDLVREAAIDPELPVIDTHHHLWDYPDSRYLPSDFVAEFGGHQVAATVYVECRSMYRTDGPELLRPLGETEFACRVGEEADAGAYGPARLCAAIVGRADLAVGESIRPVLEAQLAAGHGRLRGIRNISGWHVEPDIRPSVSRPPEKLLLDPMFRRGFAALAPLGLSFDAWLYQSQIAELVDLARAFPETTIIFNHLGGPLGIGSYAGRRAEARAEWAAALRELARRPNVHIKLGGLGMRLAGFGFSARPRPPTSDELVQICGPYLLDCIDIFGAERCMFESNFPVDKNSFSYAVLWNAFKKIARRNGGEAQRALLSGTARRVYRIET